MLQTLRSLRVHIALLLLVVLVPALALSAYTLTSQRQQVQADFAQAAMELARHVASRQDERIQDAITLLDALDHQAAILQGHGPGCGALLEQGVEEHPGIRVLALAETDGRVRCASAEALTGLSLGDRAWFQSAVAARTQAVGQWEPDPLTGQPSSPLAYPVYDDQGRTAGVLIAWLNWAWLDDLVRLHALGEEWTLAVASHDGAVLAHWPNVAGILGQPLDADPVFSVLKSHKDGTRILRGDDGVERLYAAATLVVKSAGQDVHVFVAVPAERAFGAAQRTFVGNVAVLTAVALLGAAFAWVMSSWGIVRPVQRIIATSRSIAEGDLGARVRWGHERSEIGQLALAFDQMAEALQRRDSDRRRAEEEVRRMKDFSEGLIESMMEGILTDDMDGRFTFANAAAAAILGYNSPAELVGQGWAAIVAPDCLAIQAAAAERRSQGLRDRYEVDLIRKDGRRITVEIAGGPRMEGDRQVGTLAVFTDITERKLLEQLLWQTKVVVEHSPVALFRCDAKAPCRMEFVSDNIGRFGHTRDEILTGPLSLYALVHPEDRQRVADELARRAAAGEDTFQLTFRVQARDGTVIWTESYTEAVRADDGTVAHYQGAWLDITERKALEDRLLQAQKMEGIGRLAGGVAHDFNNLLTAISGYANFALETVGQKHPVAADLHGILDAAARAADLTRQLLAFSRKQIFEMKIVDLNDLIRGMGKMLRRLIGEDIDLAIVPGAKPATTRADAAQIEQVLVNLAVNARDAMPDGGTLTIETSNVILDDAYVRTHPGAVLGEYVLIAVTDTGVGMTDEVKSRIFEPFFTTKEPGKGTGLGLSTVFGIVKQHEGNIYVYSEPGVGTTFKVYLRQVAEAAQPLPAQAQEEDLVGGSETVLVTEDDAPVRQMAARILRSLGYTVLEAGNGAEALQAARKCGGRIDLLITDVVMPRMNGRELAQRLAEICPDAKVLYVSGYTENAIAHNHILDEGACFLQKPFARRALARKVREALGA